MVVSVCMYSSNTVLHADMKKHFDIVSRFQASPTMTHRDSLHPPAQLHD